MYKAKPLQDILLLCFYVSKRHIAFPVFQKIYCCYCQNDNYIIIIEI